MLLQEDARTKRRHINYIDDLLSRFFCETAKVEGALEVTRIIGFSGLHR